PPGALDPRLPLLAGGMLALGTLAMLVSDYAASAAERDPAASFWEAVVALQRQAPDGGPLYLDPGFKAWLDAEGRQDTRGVLELAGFDVRYLRLTAGQPIPSHQLYLLTCPEYLR